MVGIVSIGIVDVETIGFWPKADRIVEVAALLVTPEGAGTDTSLVLQSIKKFDLGDPPCGLFVARCGGRIGLAEPTRCG
jgi:hypothetical protein